MYGIKAMLKQYYLQIKKDEYDNRKNAPELTCYGQAHQYGSCVRSAEKRKEKIDSELGLPVRAA
jgi:hypothetical protein